MFNILGEEIYYRGYLLPRMRGAFGKWDLAGHSQTRFTPELLPTRQGFDTFFGTPTSNDAIVNLYRNEKLIENRADTGKPAQRPEVGRGDGPSPGNAFRGGDQPV